jgi:multidrug resistance efflux pump
VVVELHIQEGRAVQKGDVIARIDPARYEAALNLARAKLERARLLLQKAKAAENKLEIALAEADVKIAETEVMIAQMRLDGTVVRAPFAGTILNK